LLDIRIFIILFPTTAIIVILEDSVKNAYSIVSSLYFWKAFMNRAETICDESTQVPEL
jgi:hypothetical protein